MRSPINTDTRIASLDVIRGFAILGILITNIPIFAMPSEVAASPTLLGGIDGVNYLVWAVTRMFFEQTFLTIFSMLFGASMLIIMQRSSPNNKITGIINISSVYMQRILWLLVIGLVHAYFLWHGDVLVLYAFCGCSLVFARNLTIKTLLQLSIFLLLFPILMFGGLYYLAQLPGNTNMAVSLTVAFGGSPEDITRTIGIMQNDWFAQQVYRMDKAFSMHTTTFTFFLFWRITASMLFGMALFKAGFLSGSSPIYFYTKVCIRCLMIAIPVSAFGIYRTTTLDFHPLYYNLGIGFAINYLCSALYAVAFTSMIIIATKVRILTHIQTWLSSVGRMSLTVYISQTLICTWIFYGHGLALFGQLDRTMQFLLVLPIWFVLVVFSSTWLNYFKQGPLESLMRYLIVKPKPSVNPA